MNRIDARFQSLREKKQTACMPYITAGDPSLSKTGEIVLALDRAGADIIELGVPFSDPVGDGPVIQEAAQRALARGATLPGILQSVRRLREKSQVPILLFSYFLPMA